MNYWRVTKETMKKFIEDNPLNYSSSIAFYVVFSMPAILIIVISITGSAYQDQAVRQSVIEQIQMLFGAGSAATVERVMANAHLSGSTALARVIGIITLLFSATTVFVSLQNGLNYIWGIKPKPGRDLINFFLDRLLSLAMVISIGFILLVSLVIDALIGAFNAALSNWCSAAYIITSVNLLVSIGVITLIFALIFKILPDARIKWKDVWVGAFVTTLLFTVGKFLIGFYLGNSSLSDIYGAAGSLVLLLVWVYYSSVIVLFGAEFTYVYSQEIGDRIRPSKYAVAVRQIEVEEGDSIINKD